MVAQPFDLYSGSVYATGTDRNGGRATASELLELLKRPAWMADAACNEHPEVEFFPERGGDIRPAQAVCRGCLVGECLEFALEGRERFGIWGGTSERERRGLRKVSV